MGAVKTLGQLSDENRERILAAKAQERTADIAWLEAVLAMQLPLHVWTPKHMWAADFGPSEYRESFRRKIRERQAYQRLGCACDHCGTELINPEPRRVLASNPPKRKVACIGCGWAGSTSMILPREK